MRLLFVILLLPFFAFGQTSKVGDWLMYIGNQRLNKDWNWHKEVQLRNYNAIGDLEQLLLRTGVGYNLSENNNNFMVGYAFIHSQTYNAKSTEKNKFDESRIFQQFLTKQTFKRITLTHRYRLEERFRPHQFDMRFRYFVSANIALGKRIFEQNTFYLSLYDEIFLNLSSPVFDRNRAYAALGYVLNQNLKVESGIMYQLYEQSNRPQFQILILSTLPYISKNLPVTVD